MNLKSAQYKGAKRWSLFAKFAAGISLTVLFFGLLNALIVRESVSRSLNEEFEKRAYFISRALAEQSVAFLLSGDAAGLNMLINEIMAIDSSIRYAMVINARGEVMAHSFQQQPPEGLLSLNTPASDTEPGIITIIDTGESGEMIRDYAMAVLSHNLGYIRLGIQEDDIRLHVQRTVTALWLMVSLFLLLGLLAALFFSYTIATPLRALSRQSALIDIQNIQTGLSDLKSSMHRLYFRLRRPFGLGDEIDILYENYVSMLQRLEQAYKTMHELQQSLFHSEKLASIGTLTAGVAHEINNPLAGISIGLKRIARRPEDAAQVREYTALMQEALGRIEHVIADLLVFSRKDELRFEETELCALLQRTIKLARYRVKAARIDIDLAGDDCPVFLWLSPNRIEQVFLNIIINALDAVRERIDKHPEHKGQIGIFFQRNEQNFRVLVEDNGIGVQEENINKLFDPFFTTKKVGEGTGLGLSVSYQIMRDHGGEIRFESEQGKGSRFYVCFPTERIIEKQ